MRKHVHRQCSKNNPKLMSTLRLVLLLRFLFVVFLFVGGNLIHRNIS